VGQKIFFHPNYFYGPGPAPTTPGCCTPVQAPKKKKSSGSGPTGLDGYLKFNGYWLLYGTVHRIVPTLYCSMTQAPLRYLCLWSQLAFLAKEDPVLGISGLDPRVLEFSTPKTPPLKYPGD
jgi:hypothetical protein